MMRWQGWSQWTGDALILARDNIDTDQIYPGRFLSLTDRREMFDAFFADWRFLPDGTKNPSDPFRETQSILVAGENFGCGSSREHAVWVLADHGFRAVLARSFAPIFKQNAVANGIAPIVLPDAAWLFLCAHVDAHVRVRVDLSARAITIAAGSQAEPLDEKNFAIELDSFDVHCLTHGLDALSFLLSIAEKNAEIFASKKKSQHALTVFNPGGIVP